jgi:hypothetical protein
MSKYLESIEIQAPVNREDLVRLPYEQDVYLCGETHTRWREIGGLLKRDYQGEEDWKKMAEYVNKAYYDVFIDAYKYAEGSISS